MNHYEIVFIFNPDEKQSGKSLLEKIKEIAFRKKNAPVIARIDEMMRQINQQGNDNG